MPVHCKVRLVSGPANGRKDACVRIRDLSLLAMAKQCVRLPQHKSVRTEKKGMVPVKSGTQQLLPKCLPRQRECAGRTSRFAVLKQEDCFAEHY